MAAVGPRIRGLARRVWRARDHAGTAQTEMPRVCMRCGSREAFALGTALRADFDVTVLPERLRSAFADGADGVCGRCGLYQQYNRYTPDEVREYRSVMTSKDLSVGEEAFHTFPVPDDFVRDWERKYVSQRVERWDSFFAGANIQPKRCLFLRPMFGGTAEWTRARFGAELAGLEISDVCRRTVEARLPEFTFLDGDIHAVLEGPFLAERPFDVIFVFHTVVHCVDAGDALAKLRSLTADGGVCVFSHEIQRKPWNPFHVLYPSEWQFLDLLREHFDGVARIDDCDPEPSSLTTDFTAKGDSPDVVAWRRGGSPR